MLTRAASAALLLLLIAGCANNAGTQAGAPGSAASPAPATSDVIDLPLPSAANPSVSPGARKPLTGGTQTITGTVAAGIEPNCLVLQAGSDSYLLVFDDAAMRADAAVGKKVTLVGQPQPGMMSTCQQGVPFIVAAVRAG
jgi:hypothetical protein